MEYAEKIVNLDNNWIKLEFCMGCGAAVMSKELHNDWHEAYAKTDLKASHADLMLRPIGPRQEDRITSSKWIEEQTKRMFPDHA